jgi:excisionase family DNA binding protein
MIVAVTDPTVARHFVVALRAHVRQCRRDQVLVPPAVAALLAGLLASDGLACPVLDDLDADRDAMAVTPLLVDYRAAADALSVSERSVRRRVAARRLPAVDAGGNRRIRAADLVAYVERLSTERTATSTSTAWGAYARPGSGFPISVPPSAEDIAGREAFAAREEKRTERAAVAEEIRTRQAVVRARSGCGGSVVRWPNRAPTWAVGDASCVKLARTIKMPSGILPRPPGCVWPLQGAVDGLTAGRQPCGEGRLSDAWRPAPSRRDAQSRTRYD